MSDAVSEALVPELLGLLGEPAFVAFVQSFGGRRLYVPGAIAADHEIAAVVGESAATRLSSRYAPSTIRVPLARMIRARHYRANGRSNGQIATLLGVTETAVDKMFRRMEKPPLKGSASQLSLFPD